MSQGGKGYASASDAPATNPTSPVNSLQNQLLIELLKKNISAVSPSASTIPPLKTTSPLNAECDLASGMMRAVEDIKTIVDRLNGLSGEILNGMERKRLNDLRVNHIIWFFRRVQSAREILEEFSRIPCDPEIDQVRETMANFIKHLQNDKDRLSEINEDYVEVVATLRAQGLETMERIESILSSISIIKNNLVTEFPDPNVGYFRDSVVDLLTNYQSQLISRASSTFGLFSPISDSIKFDRMEKKSRNISSLITCVSQQFREQRPSFKRSIAENRRLAEENRKLRELLHSQQLVYEERSKELKNEIVLLGTEIEILKSKEQLTPPTSVTRKRRATTDPVIAFTGLSRDIEFQKDLADTAQSLGGKVHLSADFTSEISHVVAPNGYQSVRTMAAALSSKWIMSTDWLVESKKTGKLLPEHSFGNLYKEGLSTLRNKTFFMTAAFISQQSHHQMNAACCRTLIGPIGKGRFVDDVSLAEYILCGDTEQRSTRHWLRLKDFIKMIPGH